MPVIIPRTTRHSQLKDVDTPHVAADLATGVLGMELVDDTTLTATATTYSIASIDLEADGAYLILLTMKAGAAGSQHVRCYYNSDTTDTNYYYQYMQATHNTLSGARANDAILHTCDAGFPSNCMMLISKVAGEEATAMKVGHAGKTPAGVFLQHIVQMWTATTNVTQIDLTSASADGFAVGTRFQVFRMV